MRRGMAGRLSLLRSVSSASKCAAVVSLNRVRYASSALRVASSTSARLSPRCGTRIRTLRPARVVSQLLHRLNVFDLRRQIDLRRRDAKLVELHQRRMQHIGFPAGDGAGIGPELDAFDDAAASHLKDLNRAAARSELQAEHVSIAKPGARHLLLPVAKRLHRAQGIAQLCRLLESLLVSRRLHAVAQSLHELVVPAFEQQPRVRNRHSVLLFGADLGHAGCEAALDVVSRQGRPRCPVITSLHERMPNTRCDSVIVRRASLAGRNGPGVEIAASSRRCVPPGCAETPRSSSAGGRGSSCRRAAGCCNEAFAA